MVVSAVVVLVGCGSSSPPSPTAARDAAVAPAPVVAASQPAPRAAPASAAVNAAPPPAAGAVATSPAPPAAKARARDGGAAPLPAGHPEVARPHRPDGGMALPPGHPKIGMPAVGPAPGKAPAAVKPPAPGKAPPLDPTKPMPAGHPAVPGMTKGATPPAGAPAPMPHMLGGGALVAAGTIAATPAVRGRIKPGQYIFLIARGVGADGKAGPIVALWRVDAKTLPTNFRLNGNPGAFTRVAVTARADQDGDAASKQPGDVVGTAIVPVGTETAVVTLDTVL
jgi:hypothetical protein